MDLNNRKDLVYLILAGLFVANAILGEILGGKLIEVGGYIMSSVSQFLLAHSCKSISSYGQNCLASCCCIPIRSCMEPVRLVCQTSRSVPVSIASTFAETSTTDFCSPTTSFG